MKFYIDFNREVNDKALEELGAVEESQDGEWFGYFIEIEDFAQLEEFERKVNKLFDYKYSLIIGFDRPTIFLDDV